MKQELTYLIGGKRRQTSINGDKLEENGYKLGQTGVNLDVNGVKWGQRKVNVGKRGLTGV